MAALLVIVLLMALCPAALAEESVDCLPEDQVLVDGKIVWNDPELKANLDNLTTGGREISASLMQRSVRQLVLKADHPVSDLSVLQLCKRMQNLYITSDRLNSLEPISHCDGLQFLQLTDCNTVDLEPLTRCKSLTMLVINGGEWDLTPLASMKKLTVLKLYNMSADLSVVAQLSKLETLDLQHVQGDLAALAGMKKLTDLTVYGAEPSALATLLTDRKKALKTLQIGECDLTVELASAVAACTKLDSLTLDDVPSLDLAALGPMKSLTTLWLSGIAQTGDLSGLSALKKLKVLHLSNLKDAQLAGLEAVPKLEELTLHTVDSADLSFIGKQAKLKSLVMTACRPADYAFLGDLACKKSLQKLWLVGADVSDLSFAADLKSLADLVLYDTAVADISVLSGLGKLESVKLYGNPIADYSPLASVKKLATVQLGDALSTLVVEELQAQMPDVQVTSVAAEVDPLYDAAVFFGDENPLERANRPDPCAEVNLKLGQAALARRMEQSRAEAAEAMANAYVLTPTELKYYSPEDEAYTVYGIDSKEPIVRIPAEILGLPVTAVSSLWAQWYDGFDGIKTVVIPASVKEIDGIRINDLERILVEEESESFFSLDGVLCSKDMKTLYLYPANKESAGGYSIPQGVETVKLNAFNGYHYNTNRDGFAVKIPASVTSFETTIPDERDSSVIDTMDITSFTVAADNPVYAALEGSLVSKDQKTLVALARTTYDTVHIPEGIETLGPNSINISCNTLHIPASVTAIEGDYTLLNCQARAFAVDEDNPVYAAKDGNLVSKDGKTLYALIADYSSDAPLGATIPEGIEAVGPNFTSSCEVVRIPASVTSIDVYGIREMFIKRFEVSPDNQTYSVVDDMLCSKDGKTLLLFPMDKEVSGDRTFTVPDGIEVIGPYAFEKSFSMSGSPETLILPDSVRELQDYSLAWHFDRIVVPETVTTFGEEVFMWATIITPKDSPAWNYVIEQHKAYYEEAGEAYTPEDLVWGLEEP